jgi:acyl-CoA dehydrogenase
MEPWVSAELEDFLVRLDVFIDKEIRPLEEEHPEFFDHRREFARTDVDNGGVPRREWEELLAEMRRRADAAGFYRFSLPKEVGGSGGSNLDMAIIREHLASKGVGLYNDLQSESSVVGNLPVVAILLTFGSEEQRALVEGAITGSVRIAFALTEPNHGSDATWLETEAKPVADGWVINGAKRFITAAHDATHLLTFARTSGEPGEATGISAFLVPGDCRGVDVEFQWWTFNMPSDHAEIVLNDVSVPPAALVGEEGRGLDVAQHFVHQNRIRQAASSLGAAQFCVDESVAYARRRVVFGKPLATNQAVQWPLADLHTECELVRALVRKTAWQLDHVHHMEISHLVAMCNYRANRLVCRAADQAIQVHGGMGYTRHKPFEHIYRHHRRYRITEGSDEVQIRRVAGHLFGFGRRVVAG